MEYDSIEEFIKGEEFRFYRRPEIQKHLELPNDFFNKIVNTEREVPGKHKAKLIKFFKDLGANIKD